MEGVDMQRIKIREKVDFGKGSCSPSLNGNLLDVRAVRV